jgi:predicted small integral membrane protein
MMDLSWMAWTWQTALFFALLFAALAAMAILAVLRPETEQVGILGLPTTRGDRLFLTLLAAAFIHLGWLALAGDAPLWGASLVSLLLGAVLFRWA